MGKIRFSIPGLNLRYPYPECKNMLYFSQVWRDNGAGTWNVIATVGGHSHRVSMASLRPGTDDKMVTSSLDR